jgi:hypothetical protein
MVDSIDEFFSEEHRRETLNSFWKTSEVLSYELNIEIASCLLSWEQEVREVGLTCLPRPYECFHGDLYHTCLQQWKALLQNGSLIAILSVLLGSGEYSENMRKASPLSIIVTPEMRAGALRRAREWSMER